MTDGAPLRRADERPAARYGDDRRRLSRPAIVALSVLGAVALAWWVWLAADRSTPAVRWDLTGYSAVTDTSVDIAWTVTQDPDVQVECIVRARDASGEEVGRDRVPVPASNGETVALQQTLRTSARPVTGEVLACVEVAG